MAFERPRGVRDFDPQKMAARAAIEDCLRTEFESHSYRRIGTPTFEYLELFEAKSGGDIRDHLYVFEDKSGRRLCLRPEATASVARMFANELSVAPKPLRMYYVCPMFRYEKPQKGRYREFWQAGVELMGAGGHLADAEAISLASRCLKRLGIEHDLRISHIGIIRRLLEDEGIKERAQDDLIQAIDKGDKAGIEEKVGHTGIPELLSIQGGFETLEAASSLFPKVGMEDELRRFEQTLSLLDSSGVEFSIDFGMARGLDYYTGVIFDAKVGGLGAQDQVLGGGRYDNLIKAFGGPQTPAVGFAFGIDRLVQAMEQANQQSKSSTLDAIVIPCSDDASSYAFMTASKLRRLIPDSRIELEICGRRLKAALSLAAAKAARYAVIVGRKEIAADEVTLRDMDSKVQKTMSISLAAEKITS